MAPSLRFLFAANGTRGDCQPFVALAAHMKKAGHEVMIVTNPDYMALCADLGVSATSNGEEFEPILTSAPCRKALEKNNVVQFLDALDGFNKQKIATVYRTLFETIKSWKPDLVFCGTQHWLDPIWIPAVLGVAAVPFTLSNSISCDPSVAPFGLPSLPFSMNRWIWQFIYWKATSDLRKLVGPVLTELSGRDFNEFFPTGAEYLEMTSGNGPGKSDPWEFLPLFIMQDRKMVAEKPYDLPRFTYTGCCHFTAAQSHGKGFGGDSEKALNSFIDKCSEPPVYIGWGSIVCPSSEWMAIFAVRVLKEAGCKGIICGGWAHLNESLLASAPDAEELAAYASANVFFTDSAPHEILFPRCSVIVYHGGSGTANVAMRAGKPQIITPAFYDQFDQARTINERGIGFGTQHLSRMDPKEVAQLIGKCKTDAEMLKKAKALSAELSSDDACKNTLDIILKFYQDEVASGHYWQRFNSLKKAKEEASKVGRIPCFS